MGRPSGASPSTAVRGPAGRLRSAAAVFAQNFHDPERSGPAFQPLPQENLPLYAPCGGQPTAIATVGGPGGDEVRKFREGRELSYRLKQFNKRHQLETEFSLGKAERGMHSGKMWRWPRW